jgi:hypothetical protein
MALKECERWRIRFNREVEEILRGEESCEICAVPTAGLVGTCRADG